MDGLHITSVLTVIVVLHSGSKFAVGSAELFEKHVAEAYVRGSDVNCVHQFLNVVIHTSPTIGIAPEVDLDARRAEVCSMKI